MTIKIGDITFQCVVPWVHECEVCSKMCVEYVVGANTHGKASMYNLPCGCSVGPVDAKLPLATLALVVLALT